MTHCRDCPLNLDAAKARVTLHRKPWSNSPAIWLGGPIADLMRLADAGLAERNAAGWWVPTPAFSA